MSTRADRLAGLLAEAKTDLLLVTDLVNVRYMTGYTGSNGAALIGPQTRAFATDFRYVEQAAAEVEPSYDRFEDPARRGLLAVLLDLVPSGELRLGFDDAHMTVRAHAQLREQLPPRITLVPAAGLVERLREVKEPEEIARIRAAAELADAALAQTLAGGLTGRTERAVADALERAMLDGGARHPSFDAIVASGPHGARPHAQPRDVPIAAGDLVTIDWGAGLDGYYSDCTRTYASGEPSQQAREIYALVLDAQRAGLDAVRSGVGGREADGVARAVIAAAGHGDHFGHGLGHGVGLAVHEAPVLGMRSHDTLKAGSVVTVEPGVYLPGQLGVRIEDLVVVDDAGPEILTTLDKALTVVG